MILAGALLVVVHPEGLARIEQIKHIELECGRFNPGTAFLVSIKKDTHAVRRIKVRRSLIPCALHAMCLKRVRHAESTTAERTCSSQGAGTALLCGAHVQGMEVDTDRKTSIVFSKVPVRLRLHVEAHVVTLQPVYL